MAGPTNYWRMVISQKIIERAMEYRGSKSVLCESIAVKEQRADGHRCVNLTFLTHLRYALMGFERNYQIKIPSNQLNKQNKYYSTLSKSSINNKLNPWFITGFADAEGCFSFAIKPDAKSKLNWRTSPLFVIKLHIKDIAILELIKNTLMVGKIRKNGNNSVQYVVESFTELQVILNHFNTYPLVTAKVSDYLIFKQCLEIINNGEHLTEKGLLKILGLKSSLNLGLSETLKQAFPNIIKKKRPVYKFTDIPNPF